MLTTIVSIDSSNPIDGSNVNTNVNTNINLGVQDGSNDLNLQSSNNNNDNIDQNNLNSNKEKRQKWSPDEDQILIKHHEEGLIDYSAITNLLPGRTLKAISHRWNKYLKKNHTSFALRSQQSWTQEEDEIIQREIDKNFGGNLSFAKEAAKYLPGRSRDAVASRWRRILINRGDYSFLSRPARAVWTPEEDTVLVTARREHKKGYAEEAHKHLPQRTLRAITKRWQEKLSKRVRSDGNDYDTNLPPPLNNSALMAAASHIPTITVTSTNATTIGAVNTNTSNVNNQSIIMSNGSGSSNDEEENNDPAAKRMKSTKQSMELV